MASPWVLLFAALLSANCSKRAPGGARGPAAAESSPLEVEVPIRLSSARPAVHPSRETIEAGRRALSESGSAIQNEDCGPYRALSSAAPEYLRICRALAGELDETYRGRLGVPLAGPPVGLVLIFGDGAAYRDYVRSFTGLGVGYAGFTSSRLGIVAVLADQVQPSRFATVLGHELCHLVHRRAFGSALAPWLSEGLADALGDTATPQGFKALQGTEDVEGLAERLRVALDSGRAGPAIDVIDKPRERFDRGTVSYDYESSALLVRFLLLDAELSGPFRRALVRTATAGDCDPHCLFESLGVERDALDSRFRSWLYARSKGDWERP